MRDLQIERLLGGYATGTLSDAERRALFEAALDDQELFNALQDEHALRDLLQDSASRRAIESAARRPPSERSRGWFARPLVWGLGSCAVAAGVVLVVLSSWKPASKKTAEVAVLTTPPPKSSAPAPIQAQPPAPVIQKKTLRKSISSLPLSGRSAVMIEKESASSAPMQNMPAPQTPGQTAAQLRDQSPRLAQSTRTTALEESSSAGFRSGVAGTVASISPSPEPIPYSVVKRGTDGSQTTVPPDQALQVGDSVQIAVRPPVSGQLTVLELSPDGNWISVQMLQVIANRDYTVPQNPLQVNGETRLRLLISPSELSAAARLALAQPKQPLDKTEASRRTLMTEIKLVPK